LNKLTDLTEGNDYSMFAKLADQALKKWGILSETTGLGKGGK
jgi:hypothetical protein